MALLEEWHKIAYNDKADQGELQRFWQHYFLDWVWCDKAVIDSV